MYRPKPSENEIYHVYNRGVDKRKIFLDDSDRFRFIHDLFEFNDIEPAVNLAYHIGQRNQSKEVGLPKIKRKPRKLMVEIMAFCLMPNHFHLMLRQKTKDGVTEFMRKIGTGYTNYFNQKYKRAGSLFQGKYKLTLIKRTPHFIHLPYYIHLNPLDLEFRGWRKRELKNYRAAMKFLERYRWSSHIDYLGKNNFPSVTQRDFLSKFFGGPDQYNDGIKNWLKNIDLENVTGLEQS